jgi:hypothetical protein
MSSKHGIALLIKLHAVQYLLFDAKQRNRCVCLHIGHTTKVRERAVVGVCYRTVEKAGLNSSCSIAHMHNTFRSVVRLGVL